MEICQLKADKIKIEHDENSSPLYELFETPQHYDIVDHLIQHLLSQNIAPFRIGLKNQIKQEKESADQQKQATRRDRILSYDRKSKSLSQLSRKFLDRFEGTGRTTIVIDQVTAQLQVERRRIYDIINIMESLGVVQKQRKNVYRWKGLIQAIKTIQRYSSGQGMKIDKSKKQKSLQSLAAEFLKLVIHCGDRMLSLDEAADLIMKQADNQGRKTKIRRLYDIVNVFKCLNLIEKISISGQKPGFRWRGSQELLNFIQMKNNQSPKSQVKYYSEDSFRQEEQSKKESSQKEHLQDNKSCYKPTKANDIIEKRRKKIANNKENYYSGQYQGEMSFFQIMIRTWNIPKITSQSLNQRYNELMWPVDSYQ